MELCCDYYDIDEVNEQGDTPIVYALKKKKYDSFEILLRKGANFNKEGTDKGKLNALKFIVS